MELIWLGVTVGATAFGFYKARDFVRNRLTYVDAAQKPIAPIVAGVIAAVVVSPVAWLLSAGAVTAVLFGVGVGAGVAAGGRANRRRLSGSIN